MLECLCRLLSGNPSSKTLTPSTGDIDDDDDTILTNERDLQLITEDDGDVMDDCSTVLTATSVSLQEEDDLHVHGYSGRKVRFNLGSTEWIAPSKIQVFKEATWLTVEELSDMRRSNWQDAQRMLRKRGKMLQEKNQESETDDDESDQTTDNLLSRLDALTQVYKQSSTKDNDNSNSPPTTSAESARDSLLVSAYVDKIDSFMGLERTLVNSLLQKETDALVARRQIFFFIWQHPRDPNKVADFCQLRSQQPLEFARELAKAQETAVRKIYGEDNHDDESPNGAHCIVTDDESVALDDVEL